LNVWLAPKHWSVSLSNTFARIVQSAIKNLHHKQAFIAMNKLLILFISISCLACNNANNLFEEHQKLSDNYEWKKDDKRTFTIEITDNSKPLELAVAFRCATGYMYDKALLRITEVGPQNTKMRYDVDVPVRNEKGEFFGEKGFDIVDIEYVFDRAKFYPGHGTYTYTIEQDMPEVDPLHYAMEVGLILRQQPTSK
jgi:gliding motility-associated lipoprotein GldH